MNELKIPFASGRTSELPEVSLQDLLIRYELKPLVKTNSENFVSLKMKLENILLISSKEFIETCSSCYQCSQASIMLNASILDDSVNMQRIGLHNIADELNFLNKPEVLTNEERYQLIMIANEIKRAWSKNYVWSWNLASIDKFYFDHALKVNNANKRVLAIGFVSLALLIYPIIKTFMDGLTDLALPSLGSLIVSFVGLYFTYKDSHNVISEIDAARIKRLRYLLGSYVARLHDLLSD